MKTLIQSLVRHVWVKPKVKNLIEQNQKWAVYEENRKWYMYDQNRKWDTYEQNRKWYMYEQKKRDIEYVCYW
jgi:hypothetical protein